jgi:hypothetical protein
VSELPSFDENGLLPAGDYDLTLDELETSHLVVGYDDRPWSIKTRRQLVKNLRILVDQLWRVGIENIFINGSFVEDKPRPNDIDGYFECKLMDLATGDLQRDLNALDPNKCWTWSPAARRPDPSSTKLQLPMWHIYRVELYPHANTRSTSSGILDEHGNELQFPAAFRRQRETGRPKGIVKIVRSTQE